MEERVVFTSAYVDGTEVKFKGKTEEEFKDLLLELRENNPKAKIVGHEIKYFDV